MRDGNITNLVSLHERHRNVVTLDSLRLDARCGNAPQVIAHADDPSRWIVVTPSGSCHGTGPAPIGAADAEALAVHLADSRGWGAPCVRMQEVGK